MLAGFVARAGTFALLSVAQLQHPTASVTPPAMSRADSAANVRRARSAQAAFESFRRMRLPRGGAMSGPCDIVIGRYCYWRGDDDDSDDDPIPEEPASIRRRRDELLALLDSLARLLPGDAWLSGQRVRYLVDAGRPEDAARAAMHDCLAAASWCAALAGYAWHRAGHFAAAESSFAVALESMPEEERCRWLDIGPLLEDEIAHRFAHLDCPHRDSLALRILRLGAPLYSVGGSDLLSEHLSRVTRTRISEHTSMVEGPSWGGDTRELVLRYGWPLWYSRGDPPLGSPLDVPIVGHDAGRPFYFLPNARILDHPGATSDADWQLNDRRAPAAYAPGYARSLHSIPAQVARFHHGDTAIVIAAWDVSGDTTLAARFLAAALVLTTTGSDGSVSRADSARARGVLVARAPIDSGIISLELLARAERRAARARLGLRPRVRGTLSLSDLLLFDAGPDSTSVMGTSDSLDVLARTALATTRVPVRRLGVYWETYGARHGSPLEYSIAITPANVPWYRRATESIGLGRRVSTLNVRWSDVGQERAIAARAMHVDLSRLRPGDYELTVTAKNGGASASAARRIRLP